MNCGSKERSFHKLHHLVAPSNCTGMVVPLTADATILFSCSQEGEKGQIGEVGATLYMLSRRRLFLWSRHNAANE